jgi:hypothetical protein
MGNVSDRIVVNRKEEEHKHAMSLIRTGDATIQDICAFFESGKIDEKDLEAAVQMDREYVAVYASRIAKLPESQKFKDAYFRVTMNLYSRQSPGTDLAGRYATAAAEIIGRDTTGRQIQFLNDLNQKKKLHSFIQDASSQEIFRVNGKVGILPEGVSNLILTVATQDLEGTFENIAASDLMDLRNKLFNYGNEIYSDPARSGIWAKNRTLKEGLSKLCSEAEPIQ